MTAPSIFTLQWCIPFSIFPGCRAIWEMLALETPLGLSSFQAYEKYHLLPGITKNLLFSLWPPLENIPPAWMAQHSCSHIFRESADPNCGQDETLLWLKPTLLQAYKQQPKKCPWSSPGLQQAITSNLPLREMPLRALCMEDHWNKLYPVYANSSRPNPLRIRKCKSIQSEYFIDLWGEFFTGTLLALAFPVCVHAPVLQQNREKYCFLRCLTTLGI